MFRNPFVQNIVLLLLTALLTGLLVPYLLKVVDDRKSTRQKEREAALARQAKIIDAQSQLLDDLTQQLWRWRYLCIRLTYYGGQVMPERLTGDRADRGRHGRRLISYRQVSRTAPTLSPEGANLFKQAEEDYEREIWDVLNNIRNEISRSRRLVTERAYQKLLAFYKQDMMALENKIASVRREERDIDKRAAFLIINRQIFDDVTTSIDQMLNELAEEMKLTSPSST